MQQHPQPSHPSSPNIARDRAFVAALSRSLIADRHASEDVAQDTWLAYVQNAGRIASVRGFLATVARCRSMQRLTSEGRRRAREQDTVPASRVAPSTDELVVRRSVERMVLEALRSLDEKYRVVLALRFYEDLKPKEIAAQLGLPGATVRTRLRRGLALLREDLDRRSGGDRSFWAGALLPLALSPTKKTASLGLIAGGATLMVGALGTAVLYGLPANADPDAPRTIPLALERAADESLSAPSPGTSARSLLNGELDLRVVVLEDGQPLAGVPATVRWEGGEAQARSGADGRARASVPLGAPLRVMAGATAATGSAAHDLTTEQLAEPRGLEIVLAVPSLRSVSGRVLDAAGRPVAGMGVGLWETEDLSQVALREPDRVRTTDAEGRYVIHALPPTFLVSGDPSASRAAHRAGSLLPIAMGIVMPEERYELDLGFAPSASLAGAVVDESGLGVAGAELRLSPVSEAVASRHLEQGLSLEWPRPCVASGAEGGFRFEQLPQGDWNLEVRAQGKAPATRIVRLPGREAVVVHLVEGRSLRVEVVGKGAQPVSGATLALQTSIPLERIGRTFPATGEVARARTDDTGTATFGGLAADATALVVLEQDGRPFAVTSLRITADEPCLRLEMPPARRVLGRVRDSRGRPLPNVTVHVGFPPVPEASGAEGFAGLDELSTVTVATSDADGAFAFECVPMTPLDVRAVSAGGAAIRTFRLDPDASEFDLVLPGAAEGAVVAGQVRDALTGEPLAEAVVRAFGCVGRWRLIGRSDETGRFRLQPPGPEQLCVVVKSPGYAALMARVAAVPDGPRTLDVALSPETDLRLRILDRRGAPVSRASVGARDERGEQVLFPVRRNEQCSRVVADARGELLLIEVPTGAVTLEVRTPFARAPMFFEVDTRALDGSTLELRLDDVDLDDSRRSVAVRVVRAGTGPGGWSAGEPRSASAPPNGPVELIVRDLAGCPRLDLALDPAHPGDRLSEPSEVVRVISEVTALVPGGACSFGLERPLLLQPAWTSEALGPDVASLESLPFPRSACRIEARTPDGAVWTHDLPPGCDALVLTLGLPRDE